MVVIDAEHGPIYIDEDVEIHPFSRIEGPCYIGKKSILLGAKCREGNSIGPVSANAVATAIRATLSSGLPVSTSTDSDRTPTL